MGELRIAIIGGSGIGFAKLPGVKIIREHNLDTPFGKPSTKILEAKLGEATLYFVARHGEGHYLNPSEVNYRANIFALKQLGARYVLSVSAVGSLKSEYAPGTLFLPNQFIDWTKGLRKRSFFDNGMVGHVSVAQPINLELKRLIANVCERLDVAYNRGGAYICIEGPQFSTKAESEFYRSLGAAVIGMTNVPEAFLAQEAGMAYATIAMVTDYDCWKEEHCTVEEILKVIKYNIEQVNKILPTIIEEMVKKPPQIIYENEFALVTDHSRLDEQQQMILNVLLDK